MKKTISIVAIILALLLTMLTLAGCGTSTVDTNVTDTGTPTPTAKPHDADSTPMKPTVIAEDSDRKFLDAAPNDDPELKMPAIELQDKVVTILAVTEEVDTPQQLIMKELYSYNGEAPEFKYIVTTHGEFMSKLIADVLAGNPPDLFGNDYDPTLIKKDLVQPVDEYISFTQGVWKNTQKSHDRYIWNGRHYLVNPVFSRWDVVWFNKAVFEEYGIDTPDVLYADYNWTWDTMRDAAMKLTIDLNQDGSNDIYGMAIDDFNMFISSTGTSYATLNADGTVTNNIESPEIARAMTFYVNLYLKDKCVYRGDDARDKFVLGQIAMISGGLWYRGPFTEMVRAGDVTFVPYPRDPSADKYYCPEGAGGTFIPRGANNIAGACALLSCTRYMYEDEKGLWDDYLKVAANEGWTETEHYMLWNEVQGVNLYPVPNLANCFGISAFNGDIFVRTREGEPWATIAAEISPMIDDNINRILDVE